MAKKLTDTEKYVKVSDVKRKLNYVFRTYQMPKSMRDEFYKCFDRVPYCVKGDLETSLPTDAQPVEYEGDGYDDKGNFYYETAYCPNCRNEYEVDYDYHDNYCRKCGQKLDWRVANETD